MSTSFASLGIAVESSQAVKASEDLGKLVDSAEGAQKAVEDLGKAGDSLANAGKKISQAENEATQGIDKSTSAIERQTAARTKSGSSAYSEIKLIEDLGKAMTRSGESFDSLTQAEMLLGQARKAGLVTIEEEARYHDQLGKAIEKIEKVEARELVQKNRLIEAENRRIETLKRTVNGIDPLTRELAKLEAQEKALNDLHKAGGIDADAYAERLAKIGKDRTGLTESKGAIDKLGLSTKAAQQNVMQLTNALQSGDWGGGARAITQLGIGAGFFASSMLALVAPIGVAVAAVGGLAYAYYKGSEEQQNFNKSLILTGNVAGTTSGQLSDMSRQVSATVGTTGDAAAVLATLAGNGKLATGSFVEIAEAALSMQEATGKSVDATIAEFARIADDPVSAAKSLNDQYNFLTASTYAQIVALKEQGNEIGATKLLTDTYAQTIQTRSSGILNNLSLWERAWRKIKNTTGEAIDAVGNIDREKGLETQLKDAESRLAQLTANGRDAEKEDPFRYQEVTGEISFIKLQIEADKVRAKTLGEQAKIRRDAFEAQLHLNALNDANLSNEEKRNKLIKDYTRYVEALRKDSPDSPLVQADLVAKNIQNIKDKNKDPNIAHTQVDLTGFNSAKNTLSDILTDYKNAQKELEAQQKAGLVSLSDYAKQRAAIISQEKNDVTAAYEAEILALEAVKAKKTTTAAQSIQLDQKIADARAGMIKAQKDADSQLSVLATNEKGRLYQLTAASQSYVAQLERERAALATAGLRAATGLGLGDRQASLQSSLDSSTDKFNDERSRLLDRRKTAPDKYSQEEYLRDLSILESAESKYRDTVVDNYDQMSAAQGNWQSGASSAYQNYLESARDVAGQTKALFGNAFNSMEDAVVNFAVTGKASFADFTKSILADMARIATRQAASGLLSSIAGSALGAYFGGGTNSGITGTSEYGQITSIPGRASGGPVDPNSLYEVNEKGPELFSQGGRSYLMTGADGGSVTPLTTGGGPAISAMRGGGGVSVSLSMPVMVMTDEESGRPEGAEFDSEAFQRNMQERMRGVAREEIAKSWRQGGVSSRNVKG